MSNTSDNYQYNSEESPRQKLRGTSRIVEDDDVGRHFPINKIRHTINHRLSIGSTPETLDFAYKFNPQSNDKAKPLERRKRNEKDHPFEDMKREYNYRRNIADSKGESNKNNMEMHSENTHVEEPCRCDPIVQKYCLKSSNNYCPCRSPNNNDDSRKGCLQVQKNNPYGETPIGSKVYSEGERSRNHRGPSHNRPPHHEDEAFQDTRNWVEDRRRNNGEDHSRRKHDKDLFPPDSGSEAQLIHSRNHAASHDSPSGTHQNRPSRSRQTESNINQRSPSSDASLHTSASRSQTDRPRRAERQSTREVLRDSTVYNPPRNTTNNTTETPRRYWLHIIFLWLILLTLFIYSPWPWGMTNMLLARVEQWELDMYSSSDVKCN